MLFELNRTAPRQVWRESHQIVRLALPMLVAQLAQVATGFVDTVMSGHVGTGDLAAVSLGSSVFLTCYVTLLGLVTALNPILAHLQGANQIQRIGETARQGLWFGLFVGVGGLILMLALRPLLARSIHLPPEVVDKALLFITGAALAMPAAMLHRALHAIASALNRPRAIMFMSLSALALNVPLNYILIHGLFGMPRMGGAGCGWATAAAFWFNCIGLFCYIALNRHFTAYGILQRFSRPRPHAMKEMLKLGVPIGLSFFVEISLFTFIALLISGLGTVVVACHQAVLNFSSMIYMVPQSISTALAVRVGHSAGAGDYRQARLITGVGLMLGLLSALAIMALTFLLRTHIIALYTSDPRLIAMGATLLIFAALYQLADSTQTIASSALRGYKLTTVPMVIHISSFWVIGLGLGMTLGLTRWLTPEPLGVYGFWGALVISLSVAAVLLIFYLSRQSRALLTLNRIEQE